MLRTRILCVLTVVACLMGLCVGASALEVDSDSAYCFRQEDFSSDSSLRGICITGLPEASSGTVMLGNRVIREGDILTAQQLTQMTFSPLQTLEDREAVVTYLPIYDHRVETATQMTIAIRGKEDKAPVAQDSAMETYKNLPNEGVLQVSDPEGKEMSITVTRQPRRGSLEMRNDGTFVYTPKKNKVGTDSFTYTATDPAGNVSREATVTVEILKPGDNRQYVDTIGQDCRFAAEWMKNTGLFVGEQIGGDLCFHGDKRVTRGEFLAMAVKALGLPVETDAQFTGYTDQVPDWLKPYLAAAMRAGLTAGLPDGETFGYQETVTGGVAAVMLQNAMDLAVSTCTMDGAPEEDAMAWAAVAVAAMAENGIQLTAEDTLTRSQVAQILYSASRLVQDAPGLQMYQ